MRWYFFLVMRNMRGTDIIVTVHCSAEFSDYKKDFSNTRAPRAKGSNETQSSRGWLQFRMRRAVIFYLFLEALRSDVFNFPPRAPRRGPGRMQIVTGKLCAAVKLMSSRDRDLIARYILLAPHTYTRAQFRERIYEVANSLFRSHSLARSH